MIQSHNKDIIVCIDPSSSRTGVFVYDGTDWESASFAKDEGLEFYDLVVTMQIAAQISRSIRLYVESFRPTSVVFVIEYPVMASRTGGYLAVLSTTLNLSLRKLPNPKFIWLPPMAIAAFTKTHKMKSGAKTAIVKYAESFLKTRLNHDEASAFVLYKIYHDIRTGVYKNSYKTS